MNFQFDYSELEKKRAVDYSEKVIELLRPLSRKEKYLVVKSLYETFPVDMIFQEEASMK